ncbi:hypothetical protein ACBQ88_22370 [Citrobacter braakii]|uniref:hypothetical protein n=1 Tax=Citrobacter braakii TaxID=57706 RepID=UPI003526C2EB
MTSREKFETWAELEELSLAYGDCGYVYSSTEMAWRAWQAAESSMAVQLANTESKCRELAAENAGAKKIISECREYFIAGVMNRIRPTNEGYLHMICDTFEDETPATDAFLAEVRAQGVDMFGQYHNFSEKLFIQKEAQKFAAQLRKGAANRMLQKCADAISAAGIGVKGE